MKYTGSLVKKEREQIFALFLERERLKFSDIEKELKLRSNMIAYHLLAMQKEGLLQKNGEYYLLTKHAEKYIPIFSHVIGKTLSPIPVVLVAPVKNGKILLIQRTKRPYKGYWGLIGGKILFEESIEDAAMRKCAEHDTVIKNPTLCAIMHEKVEEDTVLKHSFMLFFMKANVVSSKAKWFSLKSLSKQNIIPSDLWLIKHKLSARTKIDSIVLEEKEGSYRSILNSTP